MNNVIVFFSGKLITNMNDILKTSDTKLKLAQVEEKFRKNLNDKWSIEFDNLWRSKNMNEKIMELNELKQKHKQKHKAWYFLFVIHFSTLSFNLINPMFWFALLFL